MIPLALTAAQQRSLNAVLHSRHRTTRVRAQIMDMQEKVRWDVSDSITEGQVVQEQPEEGAHRALTLSVFDPSQRIKIDMDASTGMFIPPRAFLARATYGLWLPDLEEWVDVPVHTGPIVSARRQGDMIEIESQSMERQMMQAPAVSMVLRKNWYCNRAIEIVLGECAGQKKFDLLPSNARLGKDISLGRFAGSPTPWQAANRIARTMGRIIIADGSGTVRTRRPPGSRPQWTFTDDELVTRPQVTGDTFEVVNYIGVQGAAKGKGGFVTGRAALIPSHPLSESRLARNGVHQRIAEWIEDDSIKKADMARTLAERTLFERMLSYTEVEATVLVNPLLERHDMVQLPDSPLTKFMTGTIPLGPGSMGFNAQLPLTKFRSKKGPLLMGRSSIARRVKGT